MTISTPLFILATGVTGATFVTVAVGAGEILGSPPSMNLIVGATLVSLIGGAFVLAFKGWVEKQIQKFLELPSKKELEDKHAAVMTGIEALVKEVRAFKESVSGDHHKLDIRVSEIETRHDTEDRLTRPPN